MNFIIVCLKRKNIYSLNNKIELDIPYKNRKEL